jgi:hypothetical protein
MPDKSATGSLLPVNDIEMYYETRGNAEPLLLLHGQGEAGRALTVREIGTLSDLNDVTIRIADIAANLAVFGYRLRDELGSSTFP